MCLPAIPLPADAHIDVCRECGAELDYEDAYEDKRGESICGKCFDKMIDASERAHENDR